MRTNKYRKIIFIITFILFLFTLSSCNNEEKPKEYTVTIYYDESITQKTVLEKSIINFEPFDEINFLFLGWYNEDYTENLTNTIVTSDTSIYAKLIKIGTGYNISYDLDGGEFVTKQVRRYVVGETTVLPTAKKEPNFEFIGWELNEDIINELSPKTYGDLSLKAIYIDHNTYYKISYETNGGKLESKAQNNYRAGDTNYIHTFATKPGYYFKGWYLEPTFETRVREIDSSYTNDITLYAKFEEATNENTLVSFFGDSITTFEGEIPEGFASYYPTSGCDVTSKELTWWYKAASKLGYTILTNNSYSGSYVTNVGTNSWYGEGIERIRYLEKDNETPDVVIIHMGTNDFSHGVTGDRFKKAYTHMIEQIKYYYDDVIIYVCLLPSNLYGDNFIAPRETNNASIKQIANDYNLKIIDFTSVLTNSNCRELIFAGSHPNKDGMDAMSEYVYNQLKSY